MRLVVLSAAVLAALAVPVLADAVEEGATATKEAAPPEMSAEEKAQWDAWQKASTPGEAHAALDPMVGTFDATVTSWMDPSKPPEVSTGTSVNQWIFGGRYIEQKYNGAMMGMPFEGRGLTGYDNVQGKYFGFWIDSMSTGSMPSLGSATGKGEFEFTGTYWDPMTGKPVTSRQEMKIKSKDEHTFAMFGPGPDGKEVKMMEIVYKRKAM